MNCTKCMKDLHEMYEEKVSPNKLCVFEKILHVNLCIYTYTRKHIKYIVATILYQKKKQFLNYYLLYRSAFMEDGSSCKRNKPPSWGKLVTILSLDGGGVRGIIAGVILAYLEKQLQV